jgi:hypothetical protein
MEYVCHVAFGKWQDDPELLKEWLRSMCQTDLDANPRQAPVLLNDLNYARSLVWDYFREKWERFEDGGREKLGVRCESPKTIGRSDLPKEPPTHKSARRRIWISAVPPN